MKILQLLDIILLVIVGVCQNKSNKKLFIINNLYFNKLEEKIKKYLGKIGLSNYEILIYLYLLKEKSANAKQISNQTKVPIGKIYDLLTNLETKSLIETQLNSRPQLYKISNPFQSLDEFYLNKENESKKNLEDTKFSLEKIKESLIEISEPIQTNHSIFFDGQKDYKIFNQIYSKAKSQIILVIPSYIEYWEDYENLLNQIKNSFNLAVEKNIDIKIIEPTSNCKKVLLDNKEYSNVKIKIKQLDTGFIIIDKNLTIIDIFDPLTETVFGLLQIYDKQYCEKLYNKFEKIWLEN